ncbi:MAG: hypothetical protein ACXVJ0_10880 [Candidatus Angelobacter sp.]
MQKALIIIAVIVIIGIGLYLFINRGNSTTIEVRYPDGSTEVVKVNDRSCQMVGWQNKVGLSFSFDILKKYQGTGGFNFDASQLRQLDDLQTDFGLQFEALCKDRITGAYKGREALYDCRRSNVGNALTALRELKITLEPIKSIQDAAAQKDVVSTALAKYYAISANNFSKDCNPRALNVDRNELRFNAAVNLQEASISNGGYFDMNWQLANTPHNFLCEADSHNVAPSKHTTLRVYRLYGNTDATSQSLTIHDNFNETADLKIVVEDGNASGAKLVNDIESQLNSTPNHDLTAATIATVRKSYPAASEGLVNWVTGELLDKMGNPGAAKIVLQKAEQDPKLKEQPQFKLDFGAVLAKTGDRNQSKLLLDDVSRHKDPFYATQAMTTMQESNIPANKFSLNTAIEKARKNPKFDSSRVAIVPK